MGLLFLLAAVVFIYWLGEDDDNKMFPQGGTR